jgi:hypothetical protein
MLYSNIKLRHRKETVNFTFLGYSGSFCTAGSFLRGVTLLTAVLVFFSSLALLKMTVKPSAEAGLFTSHSPNLGNGRPLSCCLYQYNVDQLVQDDLICYDISVFGKKN